MAKEVDLNSIESSLKTTLDEYSKLSLPEDCSKIQALQLLSKEIGLLSAEKKRTFEESVQKERLELDKDHRYWSEKLEEKKFENDKELSIKKLELEKDRTERTLKIEELKLEIEKARLDIELNNSKLAEKNAKEERMFKYISLGVTVLVPAMTTIVSLFVYRKLAYNSLKLVYVDEGRPSTHFNDAVKSVKNLTR